MIDDDYEFPEDSATYSDEETKQKKTIDSQKAKDADKPISSLKKEDESVGGGFEEFSIEDSLSKEAAPNNQKDKLQ